MLGSAPWSLQGVSHDAPAKIEQLQAQLQLQHSEDRKLHLMVDSLLHVWRESPGFAVELADDALRLATRLRDVPTIPMIIHRRGLSRCELGDFMGGVSDFSEAYEHLVTLGRDAEAGEVALDAGRITYEGGDAAGALEWYHQALERSNGDLRARTLSALATLHTDLGDLLRALDYAQQALFLVESIGADEPIGVVLSSIGVIYGYLEDYESSYDYLARSLERFRRAGSRFMEVRALTNLSQIHLRRGDLDGALDYATTSLLIHEELADGPGMALALMAIGSIHEQRGEAAVALDYYFQGYAALEKSPPLSLHVSCLLGIGRLHRSMEDFDGARAAMKQGLRASIELGDVALQIEAHDELAGICEEMGDLQQAVDHYRNGRDLYQHLAGPERQREIVALRMRFESERWERDRRGLQDRIEALSGEISVKQKDLAQAALSLVEKSELLEALRKGLEDLARRTEGHARSLVAKLLEPLRSSPSESGAWNSFEAQFQQVHQGFLTILEERFPELTPTEMKVCALLRLGMPSKEVASVLHMSPRTVESHRYWVRKKLGLPSARNLKAFLGTLERG